ncbi:MAG: hypothetical protein U0T83_09050 [Bacteriovoracaceae bacterium]
MQTEIIKKFKECYAGFTLKSMAEITGIQVTRLFRIINGAEMKLVEYRKFQVAILKMKIELNPTREDIFELAEIYLAELSIEAVSELREFLKSRIMSNQYLLTAT